ncbi:glycosyltransferase [Pedobacter sp. HMF7056]|uniref:Glycosyltransferase n=1 Tax=Hufsiella ginkgonis TaxID=2695274 RepID=A0A7K1XXE1_9SPHI|nr:glycosyltransferase [Hufsiella ginkgonis]
MSGQLSAVSYQPSASVPKVAVVIINWNGRHFLERFLPAVCGSTYPNLEVVLGDNASTDDSLEFTRLHFPQVRICVNDRNYGYAGGYNRLLEHIDADYFVLLNSDVEVVPGWIEPVIKLMESDPAIAAAQPKILSWHKRQYFEHAGAAGGYIDRYGYPFCRGRIFDSVEEDSGQYDTAGEIFWASGAAFFIRKSCWDACGGFDADFFAHMEEIDLCWRLKNRGYKVMSCPESTVYHVGAGTLQSDSPFKTYLNFRNNLVMLKKNLPPNKAGMILFIRFWLDLISLLRFILQGKFKLAGAISHAHRYFTWNYRKISRKREKNFAEFNAKGQWDGSVVWAYFAKGKRKFAQVVKGGKEE